VISLLIPETISLPGRKPAAESLRAYLDGEMNMFKNILLCSGTYFRRQYRSARLRRF
jgi:hypothetical protein